MKLLIIGAGNLGSAIYRALQKTSLRGQVGLYDKHPEKVAAAGARLISLEQGLRLAKIILLVIKPQSFKEFAAHWPVSLAGKLIISVMAGVPITTIQKQLKAKRVIRAMPNLGALVSQSVTGWSASAAATRADRALCQRIFAGLGDEFALPRESLIDALTALAGSGPAYFFYLTELIEAQARRFGFTKTQAADVARQTLIGSAAVLQKYPDAPAAWRARVTSRGGTTAAAMGILQKKKFDKIFSQALATARQRGVELSKLL
ncbi:MAG: pyrroline-5-carboxylate reductase [Candidatus Magasanikbacteria bacterium]|nr:pyrroline-5-carboxylate reductase [Candidatus Magasanikbacteria bacterium]